MIILETRCPGWWLKAHHVTSGLYSQISINPCSTGLHASNLLHPWHLLGVTSFMNCNNDSLLPFLCKQEPSLPISNAHVPSNSGLLTVHPFWKLPIRRYILFYIQGNRYVCHVWETLHLLLSILLCSSKISELKRFSMPLVRNAHRPSHSSPMSTHCRVWCIWEPCRVPLNKNLQYQGHAMI